jgi:ATP-binding cassette subfamily B protein
MSRMGTGTSSMMRGPTGGLRHDNRDARHRPLQFGLIKRLFRFTQPYAATRNSLIAVVLIRALQVPALGWMVGAIIQGPIEHGDFEQLKLAVAGLSAMAVFTFVTMHFRMRLSLILGEQVVHDLRNRLFEHLQRMSMRFYDKTQLGRILSRMISDAEAVRNGVQDVLFVTMIQGGQMLVAAIIMFYYDPVLFAVVILMAPVLWWITNHFRTRLGDAFRDVQESFSRLTASLAESVNGIRVTQGFVRQDVNAEQFRELVEDHSDNNMRTARLSGMFLPLLELTSQFFIAVLLLLGGYQVITGGLWADSDAGAQFGTLLIFFFMVPLFFNPISTLGRQYNAALSAMAGAERVFGMLDMEPDNLDSDDAIELPPITGQIVFKDLCFEYEPDTPVLQDINFTAQPGQTIALVGHTGSGKSTIIKLISKFYLPTSGQLLIDDHDITAITSESLIGQLGIVLQDNFLFTGSVMDNIRVGRTGASDEEVIDAVRKLDCMDIFSALPSGLQTVVGECGMNLSLGQRQLVCFTRAMLADPRILILDEATSSVDTITESRIQKAMEVLLTGRTSFVVAHRLSTIRHADLVLVLDQARIIERGTHVDLLTAGGTYANLYRQFITTSSSQ